MQYSPLTSTLQEIEADAVVVAIGPDNPLTGLAADLDNVVGGALKRLYDAGEVTGKRLELVPLFAPHGVNAPIVLCVGTGPEESIDAAAAYQVAGSAARYLASRQRNRVAFLFPGSWPSRFATNLVSGIHTGCVGQDLYRRDRARFPFEAVQLSGMASSAIHEGQIVGEAINLARRLVNEPPSAIFPETFAAQAAAVAADCGIDVEVWDEQRLEKERCRALLAVARGSTKPPRLLKLTYQGNADSDPMLALVGKGVTFDSGGLSLKPSDSMKTMKCDMAGAATVVAALQAIARLKLPINVMGLAGLVENMPGGASYKLGDVLTARSGKTIEIHNTDAEGRLVLADVLDVAVEQGASKIVDLATLTGACVVALGTDVVGAMTNNQPWCENVLSCAKETGESVWQLPMFSHFGEEIRGDVADIKNVGAGRWGGAITAAKLLEEFVGDVPWVHLDIAGPSFLEKPKPWQDGGGTGVMVRTLVELARRGI
ncbi:MAG: leucyl aminopeptidase [Pirellulaceae bacterium]|nr:leucyl aminopeptidase [Planctomycetales bacterium]